VAAVKIFIILAAPTFLKMEKEKKRLEDKQQQKLRQKRGVPFNSFIFTDQRYKPFLAVHTCQQK
jgi:hypothetical protein